MSFFVRYSTGKFDGEQWAELECEQLVVELLNRHAGNPEFQFQVICGTEQFYEPVEVAVQYQRVMKVKRTTIPV